MAEAKDALLKNSDSLTTIQKSFMTFGTGLRAANSTSVSIVKGLSQANRDKQRATQKRLQLYDIRKQAAERKERESVVESGKIGSIFKSTQRAIAGSTKGFLGRVMDFVGVVFVGWIITNLPTIIKSTQALIERIRKLYSILTSWYDRTENFFRDFTSNLKDVLKTLTGFDFNDDKDEIDKTNEKNKSNINKLYDNLNKMIEDLRKFDVGETIMKALSGLARIVNPNAPPPDGSPGMPGVSGQLLPIHKQALDIISGPESGGDYNAMNNGTAGDRPGGSKKWLGKNLTDMTIGEVKYYQNTKKTLWAAGRYQIVPGTLPSAQSAAGLSDSDMFDRANQDLLAIGILKTQGPGAWTKYSSYTKAQIDIMYKAKNTPLGAPPIGPAPPISAGTRYRKGQDVSNILGARASISSPKGWRQDPISGRWKEHSGIDISCSAGLYISLRGVDAEVVGTKYDPDGYGYVIDIWVPSLKVQLRFAHNSRFIISSGRIPAGTSFAVTGSTGRSTGAHIHLEADSRRNRTEYYSNLSPDPYVSLIRLTGAKIQGKSSAAPSSTPGAAAPASQAQQTTAQRLTPTKTPQTIPVPIPQIDPSRPPGQQSQAAGQGGPAIEIATRDPLNSFISKTLLRELEYT